MGLTTFITVSYEVDKIYNNLSIVVLYLFLLCQTSVRCRNDTYGMAYRSVMNIHNSLIFAAIFTLSVFNIVQAGENEKNLYCIILINL